MNEIKSVVKSAPNPILKANIFSKLTFWWLRELFQRGLRHTINQDEIYENKPNLNSQVISDKFVKLWNDELEKPKPSIFRMINREYGSRVIILGFFYSALETVTSLAQPLLLGELVSYFAPQNTSISKQTALLYALGIVLCSLIPILIFHQFMLHMSEIGIKLRLGCSGLIYRKTLRISKSSSNENLNGRAINILANDVGKFDYVMTFIHDLWKGPVQAILIGYFVYLEIGFSSTIGVASMLVFIPFQAWTAKKSAQYALQAAQITDLRVKLMNEIIQGIQVIKMYAWEKPFAAVIAEIRKSEIKKIRGKVFVVAALYSTTTISKLAVFLSLLSYVYFGDIITARKVYTITSFFNILNESMVHLWPQAVTFCAEAYVSTRRIRDFLLESEGKQKSSTENVAKPPSEGTQYNETQKEEPQSTSNDKKLVLRNACASWSLEDTEKSIAIKNFNLDITEPNLCAVVGPVGSGKSSLLHILLGELPLDTGSLDIQGKLSYASQESWLFDGTIRDNILFVENFDKQRYKKVIKVCALEPDIKMLPDGDLTFVGERGVSLSGGQKARVNLARAIYKEADIYLLDDPLSAVDSHVAKHIFNYCIKDFLKDKLCVLVTHQLQFLSDVAHVVVMDSGKILTQGGYEMVTKHEFVRMLSQTKEKAEEAIKDKKIVVEEVTEDKQLNEDKTAIDEKKEKFTTGSVGFQVYKAYFRALDSYFIFGAVVLLFLAARILLTGVDYLISLWVNWEEAENCIQHPERDQFLHLVERTCQLAPKSSDDRNRYVLIYSITLGVALLSFLIRTFAFFLMCLRISLRLHNKLFNGVVKAKMFFFNNNPSGRILNRFSKDMYAVDTSLPSVMIDSVTFFLDITAILAVVAVANYWLLIPAVIVSLFFYLLHKIYMSTARNIKRIESITRSPVYSHENQTFQGLTTIRAFHAEEKWESDFHRYQNLNTSAWYIFVATARAFALWLDFVCIIYITAVTFSFFLMDTNSYSGNVGLAIVQCVGLIGMSQWGMRQTAEFQNQMTSVERIDEYVEEPPETFVTPSCIGTTFLKDWPFCGKIQFKNLKMRYSENGDCVLKDINLLIEPREKIGIVGRTGAGKSSIIQAIFRLAVNEGVILIDDINTESVELEILRSKISIIPQDPVLFSGTLRYNLDPFQQNSDTEIWSALNDVELKTYVLSFSDGLNHKISDGGSNFSMGQRQLVCLARAILKNNKILILDEATANVDPETDKLIQKTIRTKFSNSTVLTIAHRLHTIMDSDKVLVVDAGNAVEFDHPYQLLASGTGYFYNLVDQMGPSTASKLTKIAEASFKMLQSTHL